jgi:hypothetical protein
VRAPRPPPAKITPEPLTEPGRVQAGRQAARSAAPQ